MLDTKQFNTKAAELIQKLTFLWAFAYRTLKGFDAGSYEEFRRVLSEANRLHDEMFPDFEHSLYGDDFLSMFEDDDE